MNNLLADADESVTATSTTDRSMGSYPIECDWVQKFRNSGAEDQLNSIFGNAVGFILEYWWVIMLVAVLMAALTLVFNKNRQGNAFKLAMTVAIVGFLLPPILGLGVNLNPGPC